MYGGLGMFEGQYLVPVTYFRSHTLPTHIAFLRGINVSGQKIIKMNELAGIFEDAGFTQVRTVLASGNVVFVAAQKSEAAVAKKLTRALRDALGYEVQVMLRSMEEIAAMYKADPFKKVKASQATRYVTFFAEAPKVEIRLPLISPKQNVELLSMIGRDSFSLSTTIPNGDYPNPLLEKLLKIPATTRNWKTIEKLVKQDEG